MHDHRFHPDVTRARPLRPVRAAWEYLVFYFALLYFGVGGVLYSCLCAVLYLLVPRPAGIRFGRSMSGFLFRTYLGVLQSTGLLRVDLRALDALRAEPGLVIAPNHPSLLDAVLVISRIPQVGCIMKASVWDNPVLGGGARLSGHIRNTSPRGMVRGAAQELRAGHSLLVFPEGTRTRGGTVNRFRGGFALIAKHARAPVQTVFIETNSAFLGKGWPLLKKPALPLQYRARLGRRFVVSGDVQAFVAGLEGYFQEELSGTSSSAATRACDHITAVESRDRSHVGNAG
jgi:1-acyl-sn-glycerol-3-phosphate acyltransferase